TDEWPDSRNEVVNSLYPGQGGKQAQGPASPLAGRAVYIPGPDSRQVSHASFCRGQRVGPSARQRSKRSAEVGRSAGAKRTDRPMGRLTTRAKGGVSRTT